MYSYYLLLILVSSYGILNFNKFSKNFKLLIVFILIMTLSEIYTYFVSIYQLSFIKIYYFTIPLNIIFFYYIFKPYWLNKKVVIFNSFLTISSVLFSIYSSVFIVEFDDFPSHSFVFLSVISVVFALITLKNIISSQAKIALHLKPEFWLSVSVLVFFTISYLNLSLFQFHYTFIKNSIYFIEIIFRIFLHFYYIGLFLALYYNKKQNYASQS